MTETPDLLPPLDEHRVSAIEARVFRSLTAARAARAARRRRALSIGGAAAGLLVLAVVVGPLVSVNGLSVGSSDSAAIAPGSAADSGADADAGGSESSEGSVPDGAGIVGALPAEGAPASTTREIASTAAATLRVPSVADAIEALSASAVELGGYVESSTTSDTGGSTTADGSVSDSGGDGFEPSFPAPLPSGAGSVTLRVPADRLSDARESLAELGTVTESTVEREDVTLQAVDLRARAAAAQASVDRLTELVAQAGDLADLLAAESALTQRQAELESTRQQLTALESRVSLASLSVTVLPEESAAPADPTGFLDGLLTGWNGLVAAANAALIGIGFLLPWLLVAAVVTAVVLAVRRRRAPPAPDSD
ncbi:DUF4349 domain-containing protein [Rathayibacter sp. Leaf296]|uniref:DUF4349 domain-containing protein n=1 Tax=Rathayibacter sp. Leaf296 TaxID=1736327 RepID=UPI0007031B29|nr:DUF4349 domain-containing protein [Rathayibacter sp. Leaf296]KQQ11271.1 hypothetical protein ASF46_10115 [Rathayibacter sp. Leaf296]